MKNRSISLAAISLLILFATAAVKPVSAQAPKFKEGDRVEVDTSHVDVLHGGNPQFQNWSKGSVVTVDTNYQRYVIQLDPLPGKLPVMHSIPMYDQDCCIRAFGGAAPTIKGETLRVDENNTVLADRPLLDCDNLQHTGRNGQPLPVELAKKLIRCLYEKASPVGQDGAITMDIVEFTPGAARRWILYQDQGQGAANTLVYPVHVKYNVKTFYRSRNAVITGKEMTFTCFADTMNLWQCGFATGPNKEGKKEDILVRPGAQSATQSDQNTNVAATAATDVNTPAATPGQTTPASAATTTTTTAGPTNTSQNTAATDGNQPAKKKGLLDKLNDKMQKASQKIQNAGGQTGKTASGPGKP